MLVLATCRVLNFACNNNLSPLASKRMATLQIPSVSRFISTKTDTRKQNSTLKEELKLVTQWFGKIKILSFSLSELSSEQDTTTQTIGKVTKISIDYSILCPWDTKKETSVFLTKKVSSDLRRNKRPNQRNNSTYIC